MTALLLTRGAYQPQELLADKYLAVSPSKIILAHDDDCQPVALGSNSSLLVYIWYQGSYVTAGFSGRK